MCPTANRAQIRLCTLKDLGKQTCRSYPLFRMGILRVEVSVNAGRSAIADRTGRAPVVVWVPRSEASLNGK